MFYFASKILWFFLRPSTLLVALAALGSLLSFTRFARLGVRISALAAFGLVVAGFLPLSTALYLPLENRFPPADDNGPVAGIVVLGGALGINLSRGTLALDEAADRLTETAALARRHPSARIVYSAGITELDGIGTAEADIARGLFADMGVAENRFIAEDKSRNTYENAVYSKRAAIPLPGERWLLVTSAYHMPRAMGCFRKAGFAVEPWPVDYRTSSAGDLLHLILQPSEGLRRTDTAVREWIGLLAYRLTRPYRRHLPSALNSNAPKH